MKITREKRPDRVVCKWKHYEVGLNIDDKMIFISDGIDQFSDLNFYIPKSEIPNLIKALLEVKKQNENI